MVLATLVNPEELSDVEKLGVIAAVVVCTCVYMTVWVIGWVAISKRLARRYIHRVGPAHAYARAEWVSTRAKFIGFCGGTFLLVSGNTVWSGLELVAGTVILFVILPPPLLFVRVVRQSKRDPALLGR